MAIIISGKNLTQVVEEQVQSQVPTKLSQLNNNSGFVTTSGHVAYAQTAYSASNLTGNSGVSAGTYGPTGNVSITTGNTGTINIPSFTVDSTGTITYMTQRTLRVTSGCSNCSNCGQCNHYSTCDNCGHCNNCSDRYSGCSRYSCYRHDDLWLKS